MLTVCYKRTRLVNIAITVMNVFLGSLTLEIPWNSSGKHTYCNSISFDIDYGKAKDMHYNILRQNFLLL